MLIFLCLSFSIALTVIIFALALCYYLFSFISFLASLFYYFFSRGIFFFFLSFSFLFSIYSHVSFVSFLAYLFWVVFPVSYLRFIFFSDCFLSSMEFVSLLFALFPSFMFFFLFFSSHLLHDSISLSRNSFYFGCPCLWGFYCDVLVGKVTFGSPGQRRTKLSHLLSTFVWFFFFVLSLHSSFHR